MKTHYIVILLVILSWISCKKEAQINQPGVVAVSTAGKNAFEPKKKTTNYWWVPTTYQDFRYAYQRSSGQGC